MALAGEQAGRRIEADPAGAGQVDFGPGVQVGEIGGGARGAVERLHVRPELDEIAGDEARREADGAGSAPAASRESRQEPLRFSVSSGVCTPGSMRMR